MDTEQEKGFWLGLEIAIQEQSTQWRSEVGDGKGRDWVRQGQPPSERGDYGQERPERTKET